MLQDTQRRMDAIAASPQLQNNEHVPCHAYKHQDNVQPQGGGFLRGLAQLSARRFT